MSKLWEHLQTFKAKVIVALIVIAVGCSWGIRDSRQAATKADSAASKADAAALSAKRTAVKAQKTLVKFQKDSKIRRSQSCAKDEKAYRDAVHNLVLTYDYLEGLPRSEWGISFNKLIVRELGKARHDAKLKEPPAFCTEKGVGLKHGSKPDFPDKRDFSYILEQ